MSIDRLVLTGKLPEIEGNSDQRMEISNAHWKASMKIFEEEMMQIVNRPVSPENNRKRKFNQITGTEDEEGHIATTSTANVTLRSLHSVGEEELPAPLTQFLDRLPNLTLEERNLVRQVYVEFQSLTPITKHKLCELFDIKYSKETFSDVKKLRLEKYLQTFLSELNDLPQTLQGAFIVACMNYYEQPSWKVKDFPTNTFFDRFISNYTLAQNNDKSLSLNNKSLSLIEKLAETNPFIKKLSIEDYKLADIGGLKGIDKLTQLEELKLSSNFLTSIPQEIFGLTCLNSLIIQDNPIETIPPEIGQMINLRSLDLRRNELTSIPPEIKDLVNLTSLNLKLNAIEELPETLFDLSELTVLDVSHNNLEEIPSAIERLTKLEILMVNGNHLRDLPGLSLNNLPNLKKVDIQEQENGVELTYVLPNVSVKTATELDDNAFGDHEEVGVQQLMGEPRLNITPINLDIDSAESEVDSDVDSTDSSDSDGYSDTDSDSDVSSDSDSFNGDPIPLDLDSE